MKSSYDLKPPPDNIHELNYITLFIQRIIFLFVLYTMYRFLFVFQETEFFLKRIKIRLSIAACILDDDDKNKFFQDSLVGRFAETAYH